MSSLLSIQNLKLIGHSVNGSRTIVDN
ncbi:MAG: hypothetical protein F4239_00015, partial [Gammaproteobacteria bacterium]|nr:hypothetical protein [Gammaproteobacteria bacterium]